MEDKVPYLRLAELLAQHCLENDDGTLDPAHLSANQDAMDLLVIKGYARCLSRDHYEIDWSALYGQHT